MIYYMGRCVFKINKIDGNKRQCISTKGNIFELDFNDLAPLTPLNINIPINYNGYFLELKQLQQKYSPIKIEPYLDGILVSNTECQYYVEVDTRLYCIDEEYESFINSKIDEFVRKIISL